MTSVPRTTVLAALTALAISAGAIVHVRAARAADVPRRVDTIANVAAAGRAGLELSDPAQAAMNDAMTVLRRMAADTTFQKRVLEYSQKQDTRSLTVLVQGMVTSSTVTVDQIKDFLFSASFTVKGHSVHVCICSDGGFCGNNQMVSVSVV